MCATAACSERDPLDSAGVTEDASESGPATTGESGPTTTLPTSTAGTSGTTDEPVATTVLDTGDPVTSEATSGTTTGETVIERQYLLAVATVIAPDLPFQYLATNTWIGTPEMMWLHTEMQPLALEQGKVSTPRTPIGEPLVFDMIPVVGGSFELDLGMVAVPGMANPVTGGDVAVNLVLRGTLMGEDFYCGQADGELTSPLEALLTGSTFAALAVDGLDDLPAGAMVDCDGKTVGP